jgi:hypothetical protein
LYIQRQEILLIEPTPRDPKGSDGFLLVVPLFAYTYLIVAYSINTMIAGMLMYIRRIMLLKVYLV